MSRYGQCRRLLGAIFVLSGVVIVFLCLPVEALLLVLGIVLTAAGLLLLG